MEYEYEILNIRPLSEGFFKLNHYRLRHRLFAGGWGEPISRERLEGLEAAAVLLYDPLREEVVLIEQFRIGALEDPKGAWLLEVVGGHIGEGESPEVVARRESLEEAGCEVLDLLPICEFLVSPGLSSERIHLYCARVDATQADGIHGLPEEGEDIRVQVLPLDGALAELYGGRINSTTGIIALQWLALHREQIQQQWL